MKINWFPGHMHKALKDISENLKKVDVVTYILDARIPISSINPSLNKLTENKPVLYVFNKIDMADTNKIQALLPQFTGENCDYVLFNSTLSGKSENLLRRRLKNIRQKTSTQPFAQWLLAFQIVAKALWSTIFAKRQKPSQATRQA